jgi:cold shock CspA family protein
VRLSLFLHRQNDSHHAQHEGVSEMVGTIKYWNSEKQFGFLVTEDGQEFFVGAGPSTRRADFEGTPVRFDRQVKRPDDVWTQKLNDGILRDMDGIDPRNPRRPRRPGAKPVAVNVVVIDPADPGKREVGQ